MHRADPTKRVKIYLTGDFILFFDKVNFKYDKIILSIGKIFDASAIVIRTQF